MTYREFSNAFDIYSDRHSEAKYGSLIFFDEYEKSLLLTNAANEIVKEMLPFFDRNEKIKKQLLSITRSVQIISQSTLPDSMRLKHGSIIYELPNDVVYIVAESLKDANGVILMRIKPIQDDEAYYSFDNPFRASIRGYSWSTGISMEINGLFKKYTEIITSISPSVNPQYYIKYVAEVPPFIVAEDLLEASIMGISTNSNLDIDAPLKPLHEKILDRAITIGFSNRRDDLNAKMAASTLSMNS